MFELDVRLIELSHAITGGEETVAVPIHQTPQAVAEDSEVSHDEKIMQHHIESMNISLKYFNYGGCGEKIAIAIVNTHNGEVIRQIPMKELRSLHSKMVELVGMISNRQI